MSACDRVFTCEGWEALTARQKEFIRTVLFHVVVTEENLAW